MRKDAVGRFSFILAFLDRKLRSAAHPQHKPAAMQKAIDGNGEIQRRQPICPKPHGDKKRVCQDITG